MYLKKGSINIFVFLLLTDIKAPFTTTYNLEQSDINLYKKELLCNNNSEPDDIGVLRLCWQPHLQFFCQNFSILFRKFDILSDKKMNPFKNVNRRSQWLNDLQKWVNMSN